jgi:hypothetical protein
MARTLNIPTVGDVLTLAEPWSFTVCNEQRNATLALYLDLMPRYGLNATRNFYDWMYPLGSVKDARGCSLPDPRPVIGTLPAGTKLKIDRMYLRKGDASAYNSLSFIVQGAKVDIPETVWSGNTTGKRKSIVRFFARLADVNTMVVE